MLKFVCKYFYICELTFYYLTMKQLRFIIYFLLVTLAISSCERETTEVEVSPELCGEYINLEDFSWLAHPKNYREDYDNYREKFKEHFDRSMNNKNYEDAANYLVIYGMVVTGMSEYDSLYLEETLQFYEDYESEISLEAQSNLAHYLGTIYHRIADIEKSSYWHEKCVEPEPESITHKQIQGFSHFSIAQNYLGSRDLVSAEKHLVAALEVFEEVGDYLNQGTVYLLMHNLYVQNNAYDEAKKILDKGLKILEREGNQSLIFSAHTFYVHFYIEQGDTINTIKQIDKLNNFYKTSTRKNDYHDGFLEQLIAFKHIAEKDKDSATYFLQSANEIAERTSNPDLKVRVFFQKLLYSNIFNEPLEDIQEAEEFYEMLSENKEDNRQWLYQIAEPLFNYYQREGNYEKANEYALFLANEGHRKAEEQSKGRLFELERKFETERKENTILLQEKELERKNQTIIYLIVGTVFIILIFLILFVWTKNKNVIKERNFAENFASQLLQKTEIERKRIASDLHDSVSNELVNLRHAIESDNNNLKMKIDFILEEVRNISRNISPIMFDKIGLKKSIDQLMDRVQNQHGLFVTSEVNYSGSLDTDRELQLYRIIQEAITNIIKHADAVAAKITIAEDDRAIHVEIKDNGKGFDVDKMLEKGNCFGLLNITERAKYLNGVVNFQSDSNGTIIKIEIKK